MMAKVTKKDIGATITSLVFILVILSHFVFSIPFTRERLPFYLLAGMISFFPLVRMIYGKIWKK